MSYDVPDGLRLFHKSMNVPGTIGRSVDSTGKHICYWYKAPNSEWFVYRATVNGMKSALRQIAKNCRKREADRDRRLADLLRTPTP